ncbi:L-fucose:H+ symporter permease [Niveispirillum sp. SYP-B3756]|uniref:L-fucose:H+ symporter permease n=1 Tax=Niveispirillum sp. SYP-B3756 TaxID=2662178 RepID=UPI0012910396|nr:L-fucose:H+ symporter permease [Niveispirillum sp. SYP-B3756]MQP68083.1 L-fucose:H+ symporter permease [Niveispirillum sp. SYP-B3756]
MSGEEKSGIAGHGPAPFITSGYRWGFALVVSLFFLWALANNFNDILIRHFQKALGLDRMQAGFIQFVFYIGYFVMALPAGLVMRRFGYKAAIITGLSFYAAGALLFLPASYVQTYGLFLTALFVIAAGAAFLETAANPYIAAFGDPSRAPQRLNLAQSFNGFGAFIAPIIGGVLIFSGVEHTPEALAAMAPADLAAYRAMEAATVRLPYTLLAGVAGFIALAVILTRLPKGDIEQGAGEPFGQQVRRLLSQRSLVMAVVAQFFYVAAQVGIWSYFVDFVKDALPSVPEKQAAFMLSASLVMFMIGRFVGTGLMTKVAPAKLLGVYAVINALLCAVASFAPGPVAVGALMLTSFFMSVMFPTIFALGIDKLGPLVPLGSSFIIMAIIGGAICPPLMGWVAVAAGTMQMAFLLPLLCFAIVALYAFRRP